jgi:hypothetical protein
VHLNYGELGRRFERCANDWGIPGTAAKMATQQIANLALVGRWIVSQEMIERDQDAGRAEPTLQRVVPPECCLQNAEPLSRWSYPLYCAQIATVGLYRERKTSPRQHAIDDDRAGTTNSMFASDVGTSRANLLTEKIGQQHAGLRLALNLPAIQRKTHQVTAHGLPAAHDRTSRTMSRPMLRQVSPVTRRCVNVIARFELICKSVERIVECTPSR